MVEIIKRIKAFEPLKFEKEFVAIKNKWLKDKQNYYFNKPVAQCYSSLMLFSAKNRFDDKELLDHEGEVQFQDFCSINS